MDDLAAFLRARLDATEHRAKLAKQAIGTTMYDSTWGQVVGQLEAEAVPLLGRAHQMLSLDANPDVILADVAAKRRIIAAFELRAEQGQMDGGTVIGYHATGALTAIRLLATAYADHPDYREE